MRRGIRGDLGLQQHVDGQVTACRITRNHNLFRSPRRRFEPASPSRPGRRRPRRGSDSAVPAGNRRRTPAARSVTTARMSTADGFLANTRRNRCRARSRWRPALVDDRAAPLVGVRGPYTHSPLTRRPSGISVSTCSTRVPVSDGPSVPMTLAMIRRDSQMPHARSGGTSPVIGRNVYVLTAAAPRERSEPRAGTPSVMQRSQQQMVTLVNGSFCPLSHQPIAISAGGERGSALGSGRAAELTDDRFFVDLSDRRGRQRRHRDQHVGPGVCGDTALGRGVRSIRQG